MSKKLIYTDGILKNSKDKDNELVNKMSSLLLFLNSYNGKDNILSVEERSKATFLVKLKNNPKEIITYKVYKNRPTSIPAFFAMSVCGYYIWVDSVENE